MEQVKITRENLRKNEITLVPESLDDLYLLYNIISPGDHIYGKTLRRIKKSKEEGRADKGERIPVYLGIETEESTFHEYADWLRIKGIIIHGPEDLVSLGSYHTFNIKAGKQLKIRKDEWKEYELKRLDEASKKSERPELVIVSIDIGESCIVSLSEFRQNTRFHIVESIPRKSAAPAQYEKVLREFFGEVLRALKQVIESEKTTAIIVAGPGFTPSNFLKFIKTKEPNLSEKIILENASTGGPTGVQEVLKKGIPEKIAGEQRIIKEIKLLEEFMKRLGKDERTVAYGEGNVEKALDFGAIDTLIIADTFLKTRDIERREKIDTLLKRVEEMGGKSIIFSTQHPAGKQVLGLGGIIALLRFPVYLQA